MHLSVVEWTYSMVYNAQIALAVCTYQSYRQSVAYTYAISGTVEAFCVPECFNVILTSQHHLQHT